MAGKGNGGRGSAKATAGRSQGGGRGTARSSSSSGSKASSIAKAAASTAVGALTGTGSLGKAVMSRQSKPAGPGSHSQTSATGKGKRSSITSHMTTGFARAAGEGLEEAAGSAIGKFAQKANLENAYRKAVGESHGLAGTARRFAEEANNMRVEPNSRPKEGPTLYREKKSKVKKIG